MIKAILVFSRSCTFNVILSSPFAPGISFSQINVADYHRSLTLKLIPLLIIQ